MNSILQLIKAEPVAFNGVIVAATGLAILLGLDEQVGGGIAVFIGAVVTWMVRARVNPIEKTIQVANTAALEASTQTAERLTSETVGELGGTTPTALTVVSSAVEDAVSTSLLDAGFSRKERQAGG